jgi:hypothetical protein
MGATVVVRVRVKRRIEIDEIDARVREFAAVAAVTSLAMTSAEAAALQ